MELHRPQVGMPASQPKHGQLSTQVPHMGGRYSQVTRDLYPHLGCFLLSLCGNCIALPFSVRRGPVLSRRGTTMSYWEVAGNTDPTALPHSEIKILMGEVDNLFLGEFLGKPQQT